MQPGLPPKLTEEQMAVATMISEGPRLKQIPNRLGVSEATVNRRVRELKDIYGVESLPELAAKHREFHPVEKGLSLTPDYLNGQNAALHRLIAIATLAVLMTGLAAALAFVAVSLTDLSEGQVTVENPPRPS